MSRPTLFRNARIMDPATGRDETGDVLVKGGMIAAIGAVGDAPKKAKIVDCAGHILAPGIVDMRVFIGEPGGEHRETIKTAGRAAAAGGVTTMVMMPDTEPAIDDISLVSFVSGTARAKSKVFILPCAALTKGLDGERMTEIGLLKRAGAVAFGDGRRTIASAQTMSRAMTYVRDCDGLVLASLNDASLGSGVMNSGTIATRMGLSGIPREAEIIPLERDLRLVGMTGVRYHAACISTAESVDVVRGGKARGLNVTAGIAIANLALSEVDIGPYRTFFKVSPPLRSDDDRRAMVDAVRDGTIDVIVSNHNPQDVDTKRLPFADAADGAVGLETLLAATLRLHHTDDVPLMRLLECLTSGPAERLGLATGRIAVGAPADLMLFDPHEPWVLKEDMLRSRSKNTPFENARFEGRVLRTVVGGKTVFNIEKTRHREHG